jgi:hypothetical protein
MNDDALDALLSRPLAEVADDGFSARVALAASAEEKRRAWWAWAAPALAACAVAPFLPLKEFGDTVMQMTPALANSGAVALAAAALVLTFALEQHFRALRSAL